MFNTPISQRAALSRLFTGRAHFPPVSLLWRYWERFCGRYLHRPSGCGIFWAHFTQAGGPGCQNIKEHFPQHLINLSCCLSGVITFPRPGRLTLPEPLILGQLEPREISVKIDHKECIGDNRFYVFRSFLTSSGWIFLLMGRIKGNILEPQRSAVTSVHSCSQSCFWAVGLLRLCCEAHKKGLTHCSFNSVLVQ